jgi:Do/DeqQ family serine protease
MSPTHPIRTRGPLGRTAAVALAAALVGAGVSGVVATLSATTPGVAATPGAATASPTAPGATPVVVPAASYSPIVERVAPAVVTIRVERLAAATRTGLPAPFREFFDLDPRRLPRERQGALGSGVVIRADGLVLTNHHVIDQAGTIRVEFADGRSLAATLVGSDPPSDLALLRVQASGLPTVAFGDSDRVKVGDVVLALGNPLGVGQTVTMGIVSAKGRATGVSDGSYEDFLQTDAPINQGNSGGALVNLAGELIGINAQIVSPSGGNVGLGFAIPSAMARAVSDQLAASGTVRRAKLGVTVQALSPDLAASLGLADAHGALVSGVEPGSPAASAGLRQGDVVTALDGAPVVDANLLRNRIAQSAPGSTVTLDVLRDGRTRSVTARLAERERQIAEARPVVDDVSGESGVGMTVAPVTRQIARDLELPGNAEGVVVTAVDPSGLAASAGLRPGDLIKSVNGRSVDSVPALRRALAARTDRPALVLVSRQGVDTFVALPQPS